MRSIRENILPGFIAICIAVCTGCMSKRIGKAMAPMLLEAAVEPLLGAPLDLSCGANEFRLTQGRWPKDFPELLGFLKKSCSETYRKLAAMQFSRIEFSNEPDGQLRVTAEYSVASSTRTPSGINATFSSGTVTINDLRIAPTDPRELTPRGAP